MLIATSGERVIPCLARGLKSMVGSRVVSGFDQLYIRSLLSSRLQPLIAVIETSNVHRASACSCTFKYDGFDAVCTAGQPVRFEVCSATASDCCVDICG